MGGGRYFQEMASSLSSQSNSGIAEPSRNRHSDHLEGSNEPISEQALSSEEPAGITVSNLLKMTSRDTSSAETDSIQQGEWPGRASGDCGRESIQGTGTDISQKSDTATGEKQDKVISKKRNRKPPIPLGAVKYPTKESLRYAAVLLGVRGTICKQNIETYIGTEALFEDVKCALNTWKANNVHIALITCSMSLTQIKDLLGVELITCVDAILDEDSTGPLDLTDTYISIAKFLHVTPEKILFAGSVYEHVAAASEAGFQVAIVVRPDNPPLPRDVRYKMCSKLTHLIPASLLIDRGDYASSEGSATSC
eukprot:jgi/Galph1/433/GphlegSOOS_G5216.1